MTRKGRGKRGGKKTPKHLDIYFTRGLIAEDDYKVFWPEYWAATNKAAYVKEFLSEIEVTPAPAPIRIETEIRHSIDSVKRDISKLKKQTGQEFRIARRDRFGRFNSRGRSYQAIKAGKSRKK